MIISASYRTDIPAFYGDWFARRREAGFALVKNPYGGKPARLELSHDAVDAYVFWSRNAAPFFGQLRALAREGAPFTLQYTLTGYGPGLEAATPPVERSLQVMRELSAEFGPRVLVWRYDPIVLTSQNPPAWHLAQFQRLADALTGVCDEVVVSFMQPYRKTRRNMEIAGKKAQFETLFPDLRQQQRLADGLQKIALDRGLALTACTQPGLHLTPARCIDTARLSDVAGRQLSARTKGNRPGCLCGESRDIGAYDSCAQGCAYCYAVSSPERAQKFLQQHNPTGEAL